MGARRERVSLHAGAHVTATASVVCVREDVPARDVVSLLDDRGAPFVLVVDTGDRIVGAVWPGPAVFQAVLPALLLWFAALTVTLRFRLLERALGLGTLHT